MNVLTGWSPLKRWVQFPLRTQSENTHRREHWRVTRKRSKEQRFITSAMVSAYLARATPTWPLTIRMVRVSPGTLDAHDNLRGALKSAVDGVADALGLRDDDPKLVWTYDQERACEYAVRVEFLQP